MTTTMTMILLVLAGASLVAYLIRREARLRWLRGTKTSPDYVLNLVLRSTALATGGISLGAAVLGVMSTGSPHGPAQSWTLRPRAERTSEIASRRGSSRASGPSTFQSGPPVQQTRCPCPEATLLYI